MIPSNLFFDLVDAGVAFKIAKHDLNGPDHIISVTRPYKGLIAIKVNDESLRGSSATIIGRLNTWLITEPTTPGRLQRLSVKDVPFLDPGTVINYSIEPEGVRGAAADFGTSIPVELIIKASEYPNQYPRTAIISAQYGAGKSKKQALYIMELKPDNTFVEITRLTRNALPKAIHAKLATSDAGGWYEETFTKLYGEEALSEAIQSNERAHISWVDELKKIKHALRF